MSAVDTTNSNSPNLTILNNEWLAARAAAEAAQVHHNQISQSGTPDEVAAAYAACARASADVARAEAAKKVLLDGGSLEAIPQPPQPDGPDFVTGFCGVGTRQTKLVKREADAKPDDTIVTGPDGIVYAIEGQQDCSTFNGEEIKVDTLGDHFNLLTKIQDRSDCFIERARLKDPTNANGIKRWLHDRLEADEKATLEPAAHRHVYIDWDDIPLPDGVDPTDREACGKAARSHLPPAFHNASFIFQASSSHGIKPGIRGRGIFMLSRYVSDEELKEWFAGYPVDRALFRPNQPIFTASPRFGKGVRNPMPQRLALVNDRDAEVQVPDVFYRIPKAAGQSAEPEASIEDIQSAYDAMAPADPNDWAAYNKGLMAGYRASGGSDEGKEAALSWAKRRETYDHDVFEDRWSHYSESPPTAVGFGTLHFLAKQADPNWQQPSRTRIAAVDDDALPAEQAPADEDTIERGVYSDDSIALDVARLFDGRAVFDHTVKSWFMCDVGEWREDKTGRTTDVVRRVIREKCENPNVSSGLIEKLRSRKTTWDVEQFARVDPRLSVTQDIWDRDPMLLGVPGGVVDLRTGNMIEAAAEQHIRKRTAVAPAPSGMSTPVWDAFLDEATAGDKEFQNFLMRFLGYCLTGNVNEEVMAFLFGDGGNGKGTFLKATTTIMGTYALNIPAEVFAAGSRVNLEYYRARMAGARLVTASETEQGSIWAESLIKELTGNETPISARTPYGNPFEYMPSYKILIVGNHQPKLKAPSPSMQRRLRMMPFTHTPAKVDKNLKDRMAAEYPGILRHMIDGCLAWQREGLGTTAAVKAASSKYFRDQDAFGLWLDERCQLGPDIKAAASALLEDFNTWARENGKDQLNKNDFAACLYKCPGVESKKSNGNRHARGIGLLPPDVGDDSDDVVGDAPAPAPKPAPVDNVVQLFTAAQVRAQEEFETEPTEAEKRAAFIRDNPDLAEALGWQP